MKNKTYLYIGSASLLIAFFILGTKLYKDSQSEKLTFLAQSSSEIFVRDHSPRFGNKDAKVYLIEYLDPECESCRRFYRPVKELIGQYEGKVQMVVRYAPFHGNSKIAIAALEASREQGKYWEALELLFEKQPEWGSHHNPQIEKIYDFLPSIGIDIARLKEDMKAAKIQEIIKQDTEDLRTLNVRGTPTFFVNGKMPVGFGIEPLKELLDQEVQAAY
jgi:protein-disulfide isomerase